MNTIKTAGWVLGAFIAGGCQDGAPTDPPVQPASGDPGQIAVGPERPVDLANHAVLAFRAQNGSLVGGYRTHQAAVGDGIVQLTPFTFDQGERRAHASMLLETSAITTDGALVAGGLSSTELVDGKVILQRGEVEERLQNLAEGLHQEWRFTTAPAAGELVVEVTVSGYKYVQATGSGLHFASSDGVGLRYSNAVWSGSDGAEWPITAAYEDGRIRLTVPESIVASTVFPAVLDPSVTAEVAVDAPVVGTTGATQQNPAIAFDGTNYLVVWEDNRDSTDADIWGARLGPSGTIIDTLGIKIAAASGIQSNPSVVYNGSTYLVAWEDFKVTGGTDGDIVAATVSKAGVVGPAVRVATTATSETHPALAARPDGNALLVWSAAGAVMGSSYNGSFGAATTIATGAVVERPGNASNPAGNYLVAWSAGTDLHGQLVTTTGALSGAAFTISAALGTQAAAAESFDGTNFDVVWQNSSGGFKIYGARVSPAGAVLDTRVENAVTVGGVLISTASAANALAPSIRCQAPRCLVTWQDRRTLATTSFDVYGQLLDLSFAIVPPEIAISTVKGSQFEPVIGSSPAGFFVAWEDVRDQVAGNIFGSTVSSAGAVGAEAPLGTGNDRELSPSLGRVGTTFGLFFSDSRAFGDDVRMSRFGPSGTKVDPTSLPVSTASLAQFDPAASTDLGTNLFVAWSDTRNGIDKDVYGALVNLTTGTTVTASEIALSTAAADQSAPAVASSGSLALVVWQDRRGGTFDIRGALVNSAGAIAVSDFPISTAASDQTHPAVAWDPTSSQFFVVWADQSVGNIVHIFGTLVSPAGAVGASVQISNGAIGQFAPAVASTTSGTTTSTFAVWQDRKNAPAGGYNIYGTALKGGAALTVSSPAGVKVSNNTSRQSEPAVAGVGSGFVVVWSDDRAGQSDIFGQQVTATGTLSGAEFVVTATTDNESRPTVLGLGGTNTTLRVAYESSRADTRRVATRLISSQVAAGSTCSSAAACASGFCVDGYCCDSACGGNHVPPGPTSAGDCHGCANRITAQPNGLCAPIPSVSACRNYGSTFCDVREYCDGTSMTCGADVGRNQGAVCNRNTNTPPGVGLGTCPTNAAPGPHFCI